MTDSARLEAEVSIQESFRSTPYKVDGLWHIGKGRSLETHPLSGAEWKQLLDSGWLAPVISVNGANWLMSVELATAEAHMEACYSWWPSLNDARQNALAEMVYQMGTKKFDGFHKMLAAIHVQDWAEAYRQALDSEWARETPARAALVATQLMTGEFAT